jgi:type I restriction enzyme, S subunit
MKVLNEQWRILPLNKVCKDIIDCINKTAPAVGYITDYKMIRTTNIKNGRVQLSDVKYVDENTFNKWTRRSSLKFNDVILTREAPLGEVGLLRSKDKVFLGQRTMVYRANGSDLNQQFLYYSFLSYSLQAQIRALGSGSTVEHLRVPHAEALKIILPPLPVQKKIAAILSAYDDLIENNNRRIAILEKMAEELYREWFVRMRFPGHEKTKIIKGIPEGWEIKRLDEIINIKMGQSPPSEFYNESGEGLPFNQGVGTYGQRFPKKEIFCSCDGRIANKGDILFSVRAPVGRINIADCEMIIGRGLAALSHKQGYSSYFFYLLKTVFSSEDIIGNGAIFNSVGKDEFNAFKVLCPNHSLDQKFNEFIQPLDQKIELLIKALETFQFSRDRLLTRLMSGKLNVEKLDILFPESMLEAETLEETSA